MQPSAVREVTGGGLLTVAGGDGLPFRFQRQPGAGPARVRVRLVEADVRDRRVEIERRGAGQAVLEPGAVLPIPVERGLPTVAPHGIPAVREPQGRRAVAAVLDERQVLAVRDGAVRHRERPQPDAMPRGLVVEAEAGPRRTDLHEALREVDERRRPRRARRAVEVVPVRGTQRVRAEGELQVRDDQLLVLLLVVQAEFDAGANLVVAAREQRPHGLVHVRPVGVHLLHGRPRQRAALRPRERLADAVVVGVEERLEALGERPVPLPEGLEQEGLEEPGGVREVPLGRARVVHRLHAVVVHRQGTTQHFRLLTNGRVSRDRVVRDLRGFLHSHLCFRAASIRERRGGFQQSGAAGSRVRRARRAPGTPPRHARCDAGP